MCDIYRDIRVENAIQNSFWYFNTVFIFGVWDTNDSQVIFSGVTLKIVDFFC